MRTSLPLSLLGGFALSFVGAVTPGCGGSGGGGGGGGGGGCTIPGTLMALALEGQPTPVGGIYAAFPVNAPISVAAGGWTAFVADVTGVAASRCLFVARPNGQVVKIYAKGDPCPATNNSSGVIDDFRRIWMRPNGVVVALTELTGGVIESILTAQVNSSGVVLNRIDAISLGDSLQTVTGAGNPGTLTAFDDDLIEVNDVGRIFFGGVGSGGSPLHGIWTVNVGGSGQEAIAVTSQLAPGSASDTLGYDFQGLGIDSNGQLVTYVVDVIGGATSELFAVSSSSGATRVARNGDTPPGGRPFQDVYEGGPIVTGFDGLNGAIAWTGHVTGGVPNVGVYSRTVVVSTGQLTTGAMTTIIGPGDPLSGVGSGAISAQAKLLSMENEPTRITMEVLVSGGTTDRVFVSASGPTTFEEIFREGDAAPGGGNFLNSYPSLSLTQEIAAEWQGTFGFTSVLSDASSGVFWAVRSCDFFAVAKEGGAAPGTGSGTFASFSTPSSVSVATGFIAFRAAVIGGAATGIFRQG